MTAQPMKPPAGGRQKVTFAAKTGDGLWVSIWTAKGCFPIPCARVSQPNGVHQLSRLVEQNQFQWTDEKFPGAAAVVGHHL